VCASFLCSHFGGPAENDWNVAWEINKFCGKDVETFVKNIFQSSAGSHSSEK